MDIFTPVKSPEAPAQQPKKKITRKVRLETEQIIEAIQDAQFVGERAKKRKVDGNETKYLGALLRDLTGLARRTEPDLSLAQFMVEAQQVGKSRALKLRLADRRTSAFRLSLASSKGTQSILSPLKQSDDENEDEDDVEAKNDGLSGIAKRLDMNDGADYALNDSPAYAPKLDVDRCGVDGVVLREKKGPAAQNARSAPTLDMDIDPRDIIEAGAVKGGQSNSRDVKNDEMDIVEYELSLMREFEENNEAM